LESNSFVPDVDYQTIIKNDIIEDVLNMNNINMPEVEIDSTSNNLLSVKNLCFLVLGIAVFSVICYNYDSLISLFNKSNVESISAVNDSVNNVTPTVNNAAETVNAVNGLASETVNNVTTSPAGFINTDPSLIDRGLGNYRQLFPRGTKTNSLYAHISPISESVLSSASTSSSATITPNITLNPTYPSNLPVRNIPLPVATPLDIYPAPVITALEASTSLIPNVVADVIPQAEDIINAMNVPLPVTPPHQTPNFLINYTPNFNYNVFTQHLFRPQLRPHLEEVPSIMDQPIDF